jgi:hypothetical protein
VHCSDEPEEAARGRLAGHCLRRKYAHKAGSWFGLCLLPSDLRIRFGVHVNFEWQQDEMMEAATRGMRQESNLGEELEELRSLKRAKIGRNDLCPCGSGRKFKKCCLGKRA